MKKKYQVFISSTYEDLKDERAAVIQCLLDNNCIPVGMEQFPSSNMSQMDYIKKMLDDCDYYILIIGGRYGSLDDDGIGYTEKEYDYAIQNGIPVMAFVFDHPEKLPFDKRDQKDARRKKFDKFREKVLKSKKLVKFHSGISDLKANVATSINAAIRDYPAIGWVRGNVLNENLGADVEISNMRKEIEDLKKKLTAKNERLDNSRDEILRKANEEAVQILKEAKDLADETIRNFNKYGQGQAPMSKMEKERSRVRDKMSASEKALSMKKKETVNHKVPKKLRIGDSVRVLSMNLKGTVHTLPNAKGDLYVQMGILRSLVNIKDLVLIDEDASPAAKKYGGTSSGKIKMSKAASVSTEINLIGMTVDEAIAHLDKYLDDAYVAHLPSVRIVHGKGTGALRNAVQAHLKNQRYVKSYRMGEPSEGGAGVTIAAFDV